MIKQSLSATFKFSIIALLSAGLLYNATTLAAAIKGKNRTFPYGCRVMGYGFDGDLLVIKPTYEQASSTPNQDNSQPQQQAQSANPKQTIYLIHNKSNQTVALKAKKEEGEMYKPDHENVVGPNQWAAFAMDQDQVKFTCAHGSSAINCSTILELCQYNHAKFSDSTMGSYWVVKSDTLENSVYGAIHIGILLRW